MPRDSGESIFAARHQDASQGPCGYIFRRVTIGRAQPSARLSEEICLSEGSAGVSQRALRGSVRASGLCGGLSEDAAGALRGLSEGSAGALRPWGGGLSTHTPLIKGVEVHPLN